MCLLALSGSQVLAVEDDDAGDPTMQTKTATLTGRVVYDGEPPPPRLLQIPLRRRVRNGGLEFDTEELPERRRLMERGVPDESLIIGEDRGIANVVVWLISKDVPIPAAPKRPLPPVTLCAVNGRLIPHVLVFWNVTTLELANESGEVTNLHLQAVPVNRVLRDGDRFEVDRFERNEVVPRPVRSNIHPWFNAHVMSLNHPYFAVTGDDGRFTITDLPAGVWRFAMWHETRGFLPTDKYPRGKLTLQIDPGPNDIGELQVEPQPQDVAQFMLRAARREMPAEPMRKSNALSELHRAVMAGDAERVRDLLRIGLNVNDRESRLNGTPLHYAARGGHAEVVRMLAAKGANINSRDINHCTPLMWAAKGGHAEIVRTLLDMKAKIDATDNRKWTALHYAIDRGHRETAALLVDRGADEEVRNRDGKTPRELKANFQVDASPR